MKLAAHAQLPVSPDAVRAEFRKASHKRKAPTAPEPGTSERDDAVERPAPLEFWLLKLLWIDDTLLDWAARNVTLGWIQNARVRQIVAVRIEAHEQGRNDVASLLTEMEDPHARSLISEAIAGQRDIPNRPQQLIDVVKRLRDQALDREATVLMQQLNRPDLGEPERQALFNRYQETRRIKAQPLAPV